MPKSPQQAIYDAVFLTSLNLGYSTFDYLPANKVEYPFVYIGEQFDQDLRTKDKVYGDVQQTIHIYHTHRKRRELTDMINTLKREFRMLKKVDIYPVVCRNITGQTLLDNTSGEPLLHGIIEVEFRFY